MLRFAWIVGALALVGCKGDKDGTGDDSAEPACDITIPETFPYADQIDFYYMADLEVEFSAPDDATLMLMDASGAEVTGTTTWNEIGDVAIFSPDGGLTPSSS